MKKSGIPFGILWGLLLITAYAYGFMALGIYFIWKTNLPENFQGWLIVIGSSFGYVFVGFLGFIPIVLIFLYLAIKDRDIFETLKLFWPILAAIVYFWLPIPIPTFVDEMFVTIILSVVEAKILLSHYREAKRIHDFEKEEKIYPRQIRDVN